METVCHASQQLHRSPHPHHALPTIFTYRSINRVCWRLKSKLHHINKTSESYGSRKQRLYYCMTIRSEHTQHWQRSVCHAHPFSPTGVNLTLDWSWLSSASYCCMTGIDRAQFLTRKRFTDISRVFMPWRAWSGNPRVFLAVVAFWRFTSGVYLYEYHHSSTTVVTPC